MLFNVFFSANCYINIAPNYQPLYRYELLMYVHGCYRKFYSTCVLLYSANKIARLQTSPRSRREIRCSGLLRTVTVRNTCTRCVTFSKSAVPKNKVIIDKIGTQRYEGRLISNAHSEISIKIDHVFKQTKIGSIYFSYKLTYLFFDIVALSFNTFFPT
jgi:hypothetical protein